MGALCVVVCLLQVRAYREKMMAPTGIATMFPLWWVDSLGFVDSSATPLFALAG